MNHTSDILVIGSGIAGLTFALRCSEFAEVTLVTKSKAGASNTMFAQGGIAAVFATDDSIENHIRDTLAAGCGLCDERAVRLVAGNAREAILYLDSLHVQFTRSRDGSFDLHREGGHSHARVVHSADATGIAVENALVEAVRSRPQITILENHFTIDLIVSNNRCEGAMVLDSSSNRIFSIGAKFTMLASGGAGCVYEHNTNPSVATGDGYAIAKRAGATLSNMEFVQFHPTTFYSRGDDTFLITEALRGFGAKLINSESKKFPENNGELDALATRDIVSRAIHAELIRSGQPCVFLDVRHLDQKALALHFPNVLEHCVTHGVNPSVDPIPVIPAAHYMCGGVNTDLNAQTSVEGLFACGEVANTGVHGANRLASNSLLEGLIFAKQAAERCKILIAHYSGEAAIAELPTLDRETESSSEWSHGIRRRIQQLMWQKVGIIRTADGLIDARQTLLTIHEELLVHKLKHGVDKTSMETLNLCETALLITQAALARTSSCGCHYRED